MLIGLLCMITLVELIYIVFELLIVDPYGMKQMEQTLVFVQLLLMW
jgi:hypothetical protein